jgi:ABC-2 type transport system ATP-binding protein
MWWRFWRLSDIEVPRRNAAELDGSAVLVEGVSKSFGSIRALNDVNLEVATGTVMAVLGPNGAGKTTLVRILTTLLRPDTGRAKVAGYDVVKQPQGVRSVIGLAGQYPSVDENLTGRENLEMVGQLYHLGRSVSHRRADELLERFGLTDAANRTAKTYSGGMRRRLDLAASLVANPLVLFLDEPTTGLDPRSRSDLWDILRNLVAEGTTLLLSTQYLEEADHLANNVAVLDRGRILEQGTPNYLKECCGGDAWIQLRLVNLSQTSRAAETLAEFGEGRLRVATETGQISLPVVGAATILAQVVRRLDHEKIDIADLGLRQPTLDDVFLTLTGRKTEEGSEDLSQAAEGSASEGELTEE